MAKISPVGSNMTVLHGKKYDVLFSYETPVAAKDIKTGEVFKTSKKWSATTSKHISKWLAGEKASEKPQEFFDDLDESKKDPAKQIAEALNIMLKDKTLNESRFTQTDFGTVEYMGKRYTLKNQADFTNRLLPGNFVNYHDAEEGEEFDFEMAADATSESGEDCTVYWIFSHTKGESDSDWDSFDYTDVDRIVCEPLEDEYVDLDESSKLNEATSKDWTGQDVIESRDIIERLDELESDEDSLDDNDKEELEVLREFKNAFGDHDDWKHGIAIINRSYFVEHVKELLADIGIPENLENFPSYIAIDWDATAYNIERDYSSYDINGTEFLARD